MYAEVVVFSIMLFFFWGKGTSHAVVVVNSDAPEVNVQLPPSELVNLSLKSEIGEKIWVLVTFKDFFPCYQFARPNDAYTTSEGRYLFTFSTDGQLTDIASDLYYVESDNTSRIHFGLNNLYGVGEITISSMKGQAPEALETIQVVNIIPQYGGTLYEDAEDAKTDRWWIYDSLPEGAKVSNVYDPDRRSQVIEFTGSGTENGYELLNNDQTRWGNSTQLFVQWSMKYSESFIVYVELETTLGRLFLQYTPNSGLYNYISEDVLYIGHGLGIDAKWGEWFTFVRDLSADLEAFQPGIRIIEVTGLLIRGSGRVDDIRLLDRLPEPADSDGDQLTDIAETECYGTDPKKIDTDNDHIGDSYELAFWGESWNADPDEDGRINLLDDDSDGDRFPDGQELQYGTDPSDPLSAPPSDVLTTVYEDGEDGSTGRWEVYDEAPLGARTFNVFDEDRQSRVIQLKCSGIENGFRLRNSYLNPWYNWSQFMIEWSMRYSEFFDIYVDVETSMGHRWLQYTPKDITPVYIPDADPTTGGYVYYGLGTDAMDGNWQTFQRDLQSDMEKVLPGVKILEVNGFFIRGSGRVDDIKLHRK